MPSFTCIPGNTGGRRPQVKENSFDSALSPYIQGLLDQKRALGFKYITEEYILRSFDRYWCEKNGGMAVITQESLEGWRKRRETEGITSQSIRISTVRQLSLYMNSIGIESFVPTDKYVKTHPAIHILSLSEISELFQIIDSWHPKKALPGNFPYGRGVQGVVPPDPVNGASQAGSSGDQDQRYRMGQHVHNCQRRKRPERPPGLYGGGHVSAGQDIHAVHLPGHDIRT